MCDISETSGYPAIGVMQELIDDPLMNRVVRILGSHVACQRSEGSLIGNKLTNISVNEKNEFDIEEGADDGECTVSTVLTRMGLVYHGFEFALVHARYSGSTFYMLKV